MAYRNSSLAHQEVATHVGCIRESRPNACRLALLGRSFLRLFDSGYRSKARRNSHRSHDQARRLS